MRKEAFFVILIAALLSGCANLNELKSGLYEVRNGIGRTVRSFSDSPTRVNLKGIPMSEREGVVRTLASCESKYTPVSKTYPPRGEVVSVDDAMARYNYESCLQIGLARSVEEDKKFQALLKQSCAGRSGKEFSNCKEGVVIQILSPKARDVAMRRDEAEKLKR